jgi:hypothetical protein
MKKAYNIPVNAGESYSEYVTRVTSMPINFDNERAVKITGDGYVEVEGDIPNAVEVPLQGE